MTDKMADPAEPSATTRARSHAGIDQARRKAGEAIAATRRKGEAMLEDTREKGLRAAAETNRLFYEHPVAAVAAAAAAGAILGIFLPRTMLAAKAGKAAGRALKLAASSEAAQALMLGLTETRNVTLTKAAGKAASAVSGQIGARRRRGAAEKVADSATNAEADSSVASPLESDKSDQDAPDKPDSTTPAWLGSGPRGC